MYINERNKQIIIIVFLYFMKNPPNKILVNNIHIRRNYADIKLV